MTDPDITALAIEINRLKRQIRSLSRASQAAHRSVELAEGPTTYYDEDGTPRILIGGQEDGTFTITEVNGHTPPTPTAPDANTAPGGVIIVYDGTFEDANTPADLSHFEVHASAAPDFEAVDTTQVSSFASVNGGEYFFPLDEAEGEWYFAIVAVSKSGAESEKSAETPGMGGSIGVDVAPTESPIPTPIVGPAAVVVNYEPVPGTDADLYLSFSNTDPIDATTLHTERFPPGGFVYTDTIGNPLPPDTPVWVALWARNSAGSAPAPSAWVESSAGSIQPEYLELLVGSIIAQRLQGETVQAVNIIGAVLDIADALYAEPGYLEMKAELVEAQSAIFHNNVTRRGTNNYLEGRETASAGVTDPGTPPTISNVWPYIDLADTDPIAGMVVDDVARELIAVLNGITIKVYDLDTGALLRTPVLGDGSATAHGICRHGDWWYTFVKVDGDTRYVLWRYSALAGDEGARDATYEDPIIETQYVANPQAVDVTSDGTNLHIIHINQSGEYRHRIIDPVTGVSVQGQETLPGVTPGTGGSVAGLHAVDLGGQYDLYIQPYHAARCMWNNAAGWSLVSSSQRALPYAEIVVAADGDYSVDAGLRRYYHTPGTLNLGTRDYTYTWYDSDIGGSGTAESRPSPTRSVAVAKGAHINIKTPLPPDDGSADSPNTVRVYIDDHLQSPEYSTSELASGRVLASVDFGGVAAPLESGFDGRASATPGGLESAAGGAGGPYWSIIGDGSFVAKKLIQAGSVNTSPITGGASWNDPVATITFDVPFNTVPKITIQNKSHWGGNDVVSYAARSVTTTGFTISAKCAVSRTAQEVDWIATTG